MHNFGKYLTVLLASAVLSGSAWAFIPPDYDPLNPGQCFEANLSGTPSEATLLTSSIKEVMEAKDTLTGVTDVTRVKQLAKKYIPNLGEGLFNLMKQNEKKKSKVVTYSRTIESCKNYKVPDKNGKPTLVDLENKEAVSLVKKAFMRLFFQYPSKNNQTKYAYAQKGEQLKMDTTIEMFITAKEMQKELRGKEIELWGKPLNFSDDDIESKLQSVKMKDLSMISQLRLYERCMVANEYCDIVKLTSCTGSGDEGDDNDGSGSGDNEDMVCFWNSAIKAEKLYDTIMIYNEYVIAMLAQYRSVMGISSIAKINEAPDEEEGDANDTSALEPTYFNYGGTVVSQKITADAMFADRAVSERVLEKEMGKYQSILDDPSDYMSGDFELGNGANGYSTVIGTRGEGFADLASIAAAEEDLQRVENIHNVLQRLPDYEDIYKNYNYIKERHNLSRKTVAKSSECVMHMLLPFYVDPAEALFGPNGCSLGHDEKGSLDGKVVCHYINEKSFEDLSASQGLMDVPCPDSPHNKCYVVRIDDYIDSFDEGKLDDEEDSDRDEKIREKIDPVDASKVGGILQYLVDLYRAAIDGNAIYDHEETVLNVESNEAEGANYTAHVEISSDSENMEFGDKTRASKYMTFYEPKEQTPDENEDPNKDAIDRRKETKLEQLEGETEEEDASSIYITQRDASNDPDEIDEMKNNIDEDDEAEAKAPDTKDGNSEENMLSDTQIEDILRWTIGKEVMSVLAVDFACGLNIANAECFFDPIHFSDTIRGYGGWKDYKEFYDQYINGKYDNIRDYIRTVPDFVLLMNIAGLSNMPVIKEALDAYQQMENEKIEGVIAAQDAMFAEIDRKYKKKIEPWEKERKKWVERKEEFAIKLSKKNSEYNQMTREVGSAELVEEVSQTAADANRKLYEEAGRDDVDPDKTPQAQKYKKLDEDSQEIAEIARNKKEQAEREAKKYEEEIEKCKEEIEKLDEKLTEAHNQYIKDMSDAEYIEMVNMQSTVDALHEARAEFNPTDIEIDGQTLDFSEVLSASGEFLTCVRDKLEKIVKDTQKDEDDPQKVGTISRIQVRGSIYSVKNYPKEGDVKHSIWAIHQKLIQDLSEFNPAECGGLPEIPGLPAAMHSNIFASICGDDGEICKKPPVELDFDHDRDQESCDSIQLPDEDKPGGYFVGLIGQPLDFMAPHPIGCGRGDDGVPLREVVHFSNDDFDAISIYHKVSDDDIPVERGMNKLMFFSRRLFLKELLGAPNTNINSTDNYIAGEDVGKTDILPRFWRWILLPRTYVQKQFDLSKLIGVENSNDEEERINALRAQQDVRRSGLYPCRSYEYNMEGKRTGRTYLNANKTSTGVPVQYFIDINSDFQYAVPRTPLEKDTRGTIKYPVPLEARVTDHPEWDRYSATWYREDAGPAERIAGVPECLSLQVRVEKPETGEGIKIYDKEASALMDNHYYDYVPPFGGEYKQESELAKIMTYYREEDTMRRDGFPPIISNPYNEAYVSHEDDEACIAICGGNPQCISDTPECQNERAGNVLRLTFNDTLVRALYTHVDDYGQEEHEEETSLKDATNRVFLEKNQLGDFLEQIEMMRITQTNLLNAEKKAKTTELSLADVLKDTDFIFGDDFNMACEIDMDKFDEDENPKEIEEFVECQSDDYKRLVKQLRDEKDAAIASAMNKLSEVKAVVVTEEGEGNVIESINRRRSEVMRKAMLYQLDTPEYAKEKLGIEDYPGDLVVITGDECSVDGDKLDCSEMDEKMKKAYADWKVVVETAKEQDAERISRLKKHLRPYCSAYPIK